MIRRLLSFYTKYFAVWVMLCGAAAFLWPGPFLKLENAITWFFAATVERLLPPVCRLDGGMSWFFALTMFGIGAVLQVQDFKRIAERPSIVLIGSIAQFTIMPLGAFALAKAFGLPAELAVGLILTGSAPGAMASNVMSYIAGADVAYSVSLTTFSTLLCPLLTPGLTLLLAGAQLDVPFWAMVASVVKMVIVPLLAGFAVRHFSGKRIEKILVVFPAISVTFIIFICSLVIALNKDHLGGVTAMVLAAAIILNVYGMAAGYAVGATWRMNISRKKTLAIEIGMQNAGLGTVLALKHFGERAAIPAAVFVFICIITASIMAEVWQKRPPETAAE
ncbi:MAG TPA: bile acid:sodium symporter family protein [Sedimentisphaerales bacterium]|nr:bile acid:sodium symporter family protein [Sedimentisphaerales bacterium]